MESKQVKYTNGIAYENSDLPRIGEEMLNDFGDIVFFDGEYMAGMLLATSKDSGIQDIYHPHQLKLINKG